MCRGMNIYRFLGNDKGLIGGLEGLRLEIREEVFQGMGKKYVSGFMGLGIKFVDFYVLRCCI